MKKVLLGILSAAFGTAAAVMVHCSFMTVEIEGGGMLRAFEPGQKAVVFLLSDKSRIGEGDIVAFEPPFYQTDGSRGVCVRRVKNVNGEEFELSCDAAVAGDGDMTVSRGEILGRIIMF